LEFAKASLFEGERKDNPGQEVSAEFDAFRLQAILQRFETSSHFDLQDMSEFMRDRR